MVGLFEGFLFLHHLFIHLYHKLGCGVVSRRLQGHPHAVAAGHQKRPGKPHHTVTAHNLPQAGLAGRHVHKLCMADPL
jgi:hypothetical protein